MNPEAVFYRIYPRVVLCNKFSTIHIVPLYENYRFAGNRKYEIVHKAMESGKSDTPDNVSTEVNPENGSLQYSQVFQDEQQHILEVWEIRHNDKKFICSFYIYSLKEDLFYRRPYKGDLHIHSCRSDGLETPAYVAAACRRIGLDFMAVTDHGKYSPSIEAQEAFGTIETGLKIFRGEEVHPPSNPVHIINFGGSFSVNEIFGRESYPEEICRMQKETGELPAHVDRYQYISSVWCFEKIRESGGLGIFCHPFWINCNKYDVPRPLTDIIMKNMPFDALELLGGYSTAEINSNTLQLALYSECRGQGRELPIVGVSDAHGCERGELFGWYFTIVFSPELELPEIIGSIRELHSVAVEAVPNRGVRAYGPLRLVKYALFLLENVFPEHDEYCNIEGKLMLEYIKGDMDAALIIGEMASRQRKMFDINWGVYAT